MWPNVLEEVKRRRRFTFMLLSQNAQVAEVKDNQLILAFANPGARENFGASGNHDVLADSLIEVIGVELNIQAVVSKSGEQPAARQSGPASKPAPAQSEPPAEQPANPESSVRQMPTFAEAASAASAPEKEREQSRAGEVDIASDDEVLVNADEAAAALLAEMFNAEIIDVDNG